MYICSAALNNVLYYMALTKKKKPEYYLNINMKQMRNSSGHIENFFFFIICIISALINPYTSPKANSGAESKRVYYLCVTNVP